jgi:hypothetical protein
MQRTRPVSLQQMIRHALRRFGPDTGQATQRFNQTIKTGNFFH